MSFVMVIGGGLAELGCSFFMLFSFGIALENGINAGIPTVMMPLSSIFVAIFAYFKYDEKLHYIHIFGLITVIIGVIVITLFPPQALGETETAASNQIYIVLGFGLISSLFLTIEMLLARALAERGANGRLIGFNFYITTGIIGTIYFFFLTYTGSGFYEIGLKGTLLMFLAGVMTVIAIAQLQYAISIGKVGVVSSIYNTNTALFILLCYFFLDGALSRWQALGIVVTLIGGASLSLSDDIFKFKHT